MMWSGALMGPVMGSILLSSPSAGVGITSWQAYYGGWNNDPDQYADWGQYGSYGGQCGGDKDYWQDYGDESYGESYGSQSEEQEGTDEQYGMDNDTNNSVNAATFDDADEVEKISSPIEPPAQIASGKLCTRGRRGPDPCSTGTFG
jgi:hypothetical protein